MRAQPAAGSWKCPFCTESFVGKGRLTQHMNALHGAKAEYNCNQCEKVFKSEFSLQTHVTTVHQQKHRFSCPHCEKGYGSRMDLEGHINAHNNIRPFVCTVCGLAYFHKKTLIKHKRDFQH